MKLVVSRLVGQASRLSLYAKRYPLYAIIYAIRKREGKRNVRYKTYSF